MSLLLNKAGTEKVASKIKRFKKMRNSFELEKHPKENENK